MKERLPVIIAFFTLSFATLFGADVVPGNGESGQAVTKEFVLKLVALLAPDTVEGRPQTVLKNLRIEPGAESSFLLLPGDEVTILRDGPDSFIGEVWTQEFKWERTSGGKKKTVTHYSRKVQTQWPIRWGTELNASLKTGDRPIMLGEALKPLVKFRQKEPMPPRAFTFELAPQVRKVERPPSIPGDAQPRDTDSVRGVQVLPAFTDGQEVGCVFHIKVIRAAAD
jgi:hypothetical protein